MSKIKLHRYEDIYPRIKKAFDDHKSKIINIFPHVDVQHVGSSAVPGALTVGDLDIQIRINKEDVQAMKDFLHTIYHPHREDLWNEDFFIFCKKDDDIPMSIPVTVMGSRFDEHYRFRDLLISDPEILDTYNKLKLEFDGKEESEYKAAKAKFHGPNGTRFQDTI